MKFDEIKELMRLFGKSKLDKLKIKEDDFEIIMEKSAQKQVVEAIQTVQNPAPAAPLSVASEVQSSSKDSSETTEQKGELITSPMVGTFYAAPSPDSPPFVKVGDRVSKGQTLCILEAMKIMNELEAEFDCKILEVLVEDGEPVEYDKPLFQVERL